MNIELQIEWWPIDKVRPYEHNPRKIPQRAIDKVASSIQEFGWRQPIVTDPAGVIVAGTVRYLAALKLGLEQVPVHVAMGLTPEQVRAYRLMDNRSNAETDWDLDLLKLEITELDALDFNLKFTGFEAREIDEFLVNSDLAADEAANQAPPVPTKPVSRPGDLWWCGGSRVLLGDATNQEHVARALGELQPVLMTTDPPYGVQLDPMWREEAGLGSTVQTGKIENDDRVDWSAAHRLFPGDIAYVWHAGLYSGPVAMSLQEVGFEIRAQIIWTKPNFVLSRGSYHWQHEPCYFCVRKGARSHWRGDRTQSTVWPVATLNPFGGKNQEETATGHGTQKPIELMRRPILNHTERGDAIYDPFLGSGTTLIAAELTERVCCGLEIDAKYVDVIVCRWQQLTGRSATLDGDGRSFDEIKAERLE
jgi:DNA methylase/ParB-like nuclease family protein